MPGNAEQSIPADQGWNSFKCDKAGRGLVDANCPRSDQHAARSLAFLLYDNNMRSRQIANAADRKRHEVATLMLAAAKTPPEREYWRGYISGIARRIAGGAALNESEAVAMDLRRA